jgi:putative ABC transport system permease protein
VNPFVLALRNLLRNRRRSLTTLLAMVVGLSAVLVFGGYRSNALLSLETSLVQGGGHLQIHREGYFLYGTRTPASYGIADYTRIVDALLADPALAPLIRVVTPSLQINGLAGNFAAGVSTSVVANGVIVERLNRMLTWNEHGILIYTRPQRALADDPEAAVIGTGVARLLRLCEPLAVPDCVDEGPRMGSPEPGADAPADLTELAALAAADRPPEAARPANRIELLVPNTRGAPNVGTVTVLAAVNLGYKATDDVYLGLHLEKAQRLVYGNAPPEATAIVLQLQRTRDMPQAIAHVQRILAAIGHPQPLEVQTFDALNSLYPQSVQFFGSVFGFIAVLIGVVVLFTIGNTMSMTVVERTVEIGTLRAIGVRRRDIRTMFVCEALMLGTLGAAIGIAVALVTATVINHAGLTWTPPGFVIVLAIQILVWGDWLLIFGSAGGLIAVTVAAAAWPANRAARAQVVDALRHT